MLLAGLSRAFWIALGYVVAVLVAVVVSEAITLAPTALPDEGRFGSIAASLVLISTFFATGLIYTFVFALPGFLIVVAVAHFGDWRTWSAFAFSGAANAVFALILLSAFAEGSPLVVSGMILSCVPGGFAGGTAYWLVAVRRQVKASA